jgi:hypothetical protein
MDTLLQKLPLPARRDEIVQACCRLLDQEVRRKGGFGGLAVKGGYALLKAFKPGAVPEAVEALLDDFLGALEPFHAEHLKAPTGSFGAFMKARGAPIAQALVSVTDRRAEKSKHGSLRGMYQKLRPSALRHVEEAVPGLGDLVDRFYGQG